MQTVLLEQQILAVAVVVLVQVQDIHQVLAVVE
jgi:hypothetical protein